MINHKAIGYITANYASEATSVLLDSRPIASIPFIGRYRLIDFPLSNMANAGIKTVGLVMPGNYRSIIDHVGHGKEWMLDRKKGGLFPVPPSEEPSAAVASCCATSSPTRSSSPAPRSRMWS